MDVLGPQGNRREQARSRELLSGRILAPDGAPVGPCVVCNRSASGAMLQVEDAAVVGEELLLVIDGERQRQPARIAWRGFRRIGVQFILPAEGQAELRGWIFPNTRQAGAA